MSVHYSPQASVISNVTVGKTPITVNVSSVERASDSSSHSGSAMSNGNSTQQAPPQHPPEYPYPQDTAGQFGYPSVSPMAVPPFPPQMVPVVERGADIGFVASAPNASAYHEEPKRNAELEGIVHQTFANMALQHQSSRMRKLTGNHIVLPKDDLITIIAYTIGCQPAEVRINRGFHDVGCFEKREKVIIIDSIKIGVKDLYLAYNEKYNLLEDVYHLSLKYCFDPEAGKSSHGIIYG
jgi:hypothetical protein